MPEFEDLVLNSKYGYQMSWAGLLKFSKGIEDINNLIVVSSTSPVEFETIEKEIFVNYKTVYCGRVDGIGKNIIYDIKTTTKLDVDYISLQLSLYLLAYDEENYENYTGYVLWLPKRDAGKKIEIPLKTKEEILDIVELIKCLC